MRMSMKFTAAMMLMTAMMLGGASQVQAQAAKPDAPPPVPLKVTVSISRFDGDKKTASLPFVLWVNTGEQSSIQMGSDTPVPQTTFTQAKEGSTTSTPVQSFQYRTLGTNITVTASTVSEGLYRLLLTVNDSQVFRQTTNTLGPVFQNFRSSNSPLLRDGQTVQFAVATDKTSGEVIKLDVTLNLVK